MACPLCGLEHLTEWLFEDDICIVMYCSTHPSKLQCVLKFHTATPTEVERQHMYSVMAKFGLSENAIRGPTHPEHYHLHQK